MKKIIMLALASGAFIGRAYAQMPDPDTTARHFIIMASIGNLQEVNAGKLAAQKATKADVKAFGQMMIKDHSEMQQKLLQLAQARTYPLPHAATDTPPFDLKFTKMSVDEFDRAYIHDMVAGHRSTVERFQNYSLTGKDPQVKEFARQALPMLKEHLEAIKALDEKYKGSSAK